jgi:S-(hydroxymethyl)glutathione dehydrogenase/alcohol dehydrogenase
VAWYVTGKIQIDPMITHRLPLARIDEGFGQMHAGPPIRSVVAF